MADGYARRPLCVDWPGRAAVAPVASAGRGRGSAEDNASGRGDSTSQTLGPLTGVVFRIVHLAGVDRCCDARPAEEVAGRSDLVEQTVTWGCGYIAPSPASPIIRPRRSTRPLALLFRLFLQPRDEIRSAAWAVPESRPALHTHTPDLFADTSMGPCFMGTAWLASKLRWAARGAHSDIRALYRLDDFSCS